jgi:hypothetical protein
MVRPGGAARHAERLRGKKGIDDANVVLNRSGTRGPRTTGRRIASIPSSDNFRMRRRHRMARRERDAYVSSVTVSRFN